jgi:hypothetical protein
MIRSTRLAIACLSLSAALVGCDPAATAGDEESTALAAAGGAGSSCHTVTIDGNTNPAARNTKDSYADTAALAQSNGYYRAWFPASAGCEAAAIAACKAQGACVAGHVSVTARIDATNNADDEHLDPSTGRTVTDHFTDSKTLTSTDPSKWVPSSTTQDSTGRLKPWRVNVTVTTQCTVPCTPVAPDGGAPIDGGNADQKPDATSGSLTTE